MMTQTPQKLRTPIQFEQGWQEALVMLSLGEGRFLLDDGGPARQALSCLLVPQAGDRVLCIGGRDGERYIVHLLSRQDTGMARLEVPGTQGLQLSQRQIYLHAREQLTLSSLGDAELSATGGSLRLNARNLLVTVLDNLIQTARNSVGRYQQWLTEARGLGRLHARQTIVTADEDVRVDGERISIG